MRTLLFAILTAALLWPTAAGAAKRKAKPPKPAQEVTVMLRDAVSVNDRLVRLGDLFTIEGEKADIAVAYAPAPGKRAVFDARWLYRVARAYGLNWRPVGLQDQVLVERDSQMIPREEIEDHLRAALVERGADPDTQVELTNRVMQIYVPGNKAATIAVEDATYDARTGRFTAIIASPANDPGATRVRITGRLHRIVEVPVVEHRLMASDVIRKDDIKWLTIRRDRLPRGVILDAGELTGMAAKRTVSANSPILASSVRRQVLVEKGSLVTIILQADRMMLTAQGKAMENGSDGDTIRIANQRSKKVIEAKVIGAGKVAVSANSLLAMN